MNILHTMIDSLKSEFSAEVLYTAACLTQKYGESLNVNEYAELMEIKHSTVEKQISDETIALKPIKVGRVNKFPTIEVAKLLHKPS